MEFTVILFFFLHFQFKSLLLISVDLTVVELVPSPQLEFVQGSPFARGIDHRIKC